MVRGLRVPVNLTSRESLLMFHLADIWAARTGHEVRLVSANDHVHSRKSTHYAGLAVDLHSSDLDGLAQAMRQAGYRVLWNVPGHYAHVHVELGGGAQVEPRALLPQGRSLAAADASNRRLRDQQEIRGSRE